MPTGNNLSNSELVQKLQQARALLDECVAGLEGGTPRKSTRVAARGAPIPRASAKLDFDANERAFMKAHARGLSGPKKFALVVAFLAKGKIGNEVETKDIQKRWNKMKALLGKFNGFYSNSAKESGWVHTTKYGVYVLRPSWKDIFA